MLPEFLGWTVFAYRLAAVAFVVSFVFLRVPLAKTDGPDFVCETASTQRRPLQAGSIRITATLFFFSFWRVPHVRHCPCCRSPSSMKTWRPMSPVHPVFARGLLDVVRCGGIGRGLLLNPDRDPTGKVDANAAKLYYGRTQSGGVRLCIFAVLSRWVTDISGLIAGLGIGGLALALAAQDTASNLFGSIAIMVDKPFEIGDWVEFDGFAGTVVSVGLRSTKIRVVDQSILSVPNSKLAASIVSNGALRSSRRVAFHVGSYTRHLRCGRRVC